jgi:hypothetical protein
LIAAISACVGDRVVEIVTATRLPSETSQRAATDGALRNHVSCRLIANGRFVSWRVFLTRTGIHFA